MRKKFVIMPRPKGGVPAKVVPTTPVKVKPSVARVPSARTKPTAPAPTVSSATTTAPIVSKPAVRTPSENLGIRAAKAKGFHNIKAVEPCAFDVRCAVCHATKTEQWDHVKNTPLFDTSPVAIVLQFPFMSSGRAQRIALCHAHANTLKKVIDDAQEVNLAALPPPTRDRETIRPGSAKSDVAGGRSPSRGK